MLFTAWTWTKFYAYPPFSGYWKEHLVSEESKFQMQIIYLYILLLQKRFSLASMEKNLGLMFTLKEKFRLSY